MRIAAKLAFPFLFDYWKYVWLYLLGNPELPTKTSLFLSHLEEVGSGCFGAGMVSLWSSRTPPSGLSMASLSKVTSWSSMAAGAVTAIFRQQMRGQEDRVCLARVALPIRPYSTLIMTHWPEPSHLVTGACRKGWECLFDSSRVVQSVMVGRIPVNSVLSNFIAG